MKIKKILIVEDDFLNRRLLKKTLLSYGYEISEAKDAKMAIEAIKNHKPDLAILDINLGKNETDGISLAKKMQQEFQQAFIFVTAYDNTQIISQAVGTSPYSYLTKPYKTTDLIAAVELAFLNLAKKEAKELTIFVKDGVHKVELPVKEIYYLKAEGNYLLIYTEKKVFKCRSTITKMVEILPSDSFSQTHRAFIVNKEKVDKFNTHEVFVNGTALPISKTYHVSF